MYLCISCMLAVMSRRYYSETRDEIKFYACMLPSAGRMRALCNLRLQCLPYDR